MSHQTKQLKPLNLGLERVAREHGRGWELNFIPKSKQFVGIDKTLMKDYVYTSSSSLSLAPRIIKLKQGPGSEGFRSEGFFPQDQHF